MGDANGAGRYLAVGDDGNVLKLTNSGIEWATVDVIQDSTKTNSIQATDTSVEFLIGGSILSITNDNGNTSFTVTDENGDLILVPGENGAVVIGNAGDGYIDVSEDENLSIRGGAGAGNLFLTAGAKVYYAVDDTDPDREVATIGDIQTITFDRSEFAGNANPMSITAGAIEDSVTVYINGIALDSTLYTLASNEITIDTVELGYTLDASDVVLATYSISS